jgi:hypothetical protein
MISFVSFFLLFWFPVADLAFVKCFQLKLQQHTMVSRPKSSVLSLNQLNDDNTTNEGCVSYQKRRRELFSLLVASVLTPSAALAGIDPSLLKSLPVQGDDSGAAQRLRQVESIQNPSSDLMDEPFKELPSGVSYREYREGKGEDVVQAGSKVAVEMTIRCKSFATANEPGGVKYFSTKEDTEFNELAWTIGSGEISPALEEGMMGMKKKALRRIELPSTAVFAAKKANQLPLPTTKDGKRRFENLFKTDATLLVEVLVTRIK